MMLHANDDDIINILIDYITDNRYKQAILIDGKWGCGKTFFIKNKVLPKLNEKRLDISHPPFYYYALKGHLIKRPTFTEETNHILFSQQTYYISLYGTKDLNEITNKIYLAVFEKFFEEKFGFSQTFIGKLNLFSKLLTFGIDILNQTNYLGFKINLKELPSIKDIKNLNNIVLILDDIERCSLDINELLGFINNLTEHHNIKIILIANEEEIPHIKYLRDLPQKYDISLQIMNRFLQENRSSSKYEKFIRDLEEKTKIIFPPDKFYKKIREKTIGLTIKYEVNFQKNFNSIINEYSKNIEVTNLLFKLEDQILIFFNYFMCYNLRTFIFSIISYEKIFNIIKTIQFNSKYLDKHKENILIYVIYTSIKIKMNTYINYWKKDNDSDIIEITTELNETELNKKKILGYKFVDIYLNNRYLNEKQIKSVVLTYMKEKQKIDDMFKQKENLSLSKISNWLDLDTDEELFNLLKSLKKEIEQKKYPFESFRSIIETLLSLKLSGFSIIIEEYTNPMLEQLREANLEKDINIEIYSTNKKLIEEYDKIIIPFKEILKKNKVSLINKKFSFLNNKTPWDNQFYEQCYLCRADFSIDNKFFYYINIAIFIENLKKAKPSNINNLLAAIRSVYSFNNINNYFKLDITNIQQILKFIEENDFSNGQKLKKIAIDNLSNHLNDYLNKLQQ